ncbi:hypothetical protein LTR50_006836 [Elasticomyces elasticus]|nr:hypothetical protein LTR50_006836 [Elasticomyces elasticus]
MPTLGNIRAYWLGCVRRFAQATALHMRSMLTSPGGVLTLASYQHDYGYTTKQATRTSSLAVGLQQLGAFVACFAIWPVTHRFGRKKALLICSATFCVGAIIQTINTHSLPAFYVGRVIAGVGLGGSSVVVPMFNGEMMPKEMRGQVGSFFQWFYTFGGRTPVASSADGRATDLPGIAQASSPLIGSITALRRTCPRSILDSGRFLSLVPAALLGLGMFTLTESVRWLTVRGRHEEAWESLKWIRADDGEATRAEMEEIRYGIEMEVRATEGFRLKGAILLHPPVSAPILLLHSPLTSPSPFLLLTLPQYLSLSPQTLSPYLTDFSPDLIANRPPEEMLERDNFRRACTAVAVFTAQQSTGATAFAYFGPQYFKLLVGSKGNSNLLLTAIFGAIKVVACGIFVLFLADRVGRCHILTTGAAFMAACQLTTAIVVKERPPPPAAQTTGGVVTGSGIATVALIYLFVIAYNFSWGPLPWPYVAELFPSRTREPGTALAVASQWLFNFVFSLATPYMIRDLGWGTFLFWAGADAAIAFFACFVLAETKGRSLEEIARAGKR